MAGKSALFAAQLLERMLMRRSTTCTAGTTTITVGSSTGFVPGDIVLASLTGTMHQITSVPNGTSIIITPAAAALTSGTVTAIACGTPTLYVGLFTTAPGTDGTGGVEVTGNAYARTAVAMAAVGTGWTAPAGGPPRATSNVAAVTFPTPTPAGWGTVVAVGLFTLAATGTGDQLIWWNTTTSHVVNALDTVQIAAGTLIVNEG